ncbi:MAG: autotransporter outer membrane beta-barrel domain-containing protein [Planctomycetaceae bacterium]|nr:autotransporter outer membrane beta-barrel domain-containing protein [Planctomycetaceae bacterium]
MRAYLFLALSFIVMALMSIVFAEDGGSGAGTSRTGGEEFFVSSGATPEDVYSGASGENMRALQRNFTGRVGSRLTALHEGSAANGFAKAPAGSGNALASLFSPGCEVADTVDRLWLGGFGAWTRQSDKGDNVGYRYVSHGMVMGYDWEQSGDITLGVSGAYSTGDLDSHNDVARTKVETVNLAMYATYDPMNGLFADAAINYGQSWNKASLQTLTGYRTGRFNTHSFGAGVNVGYVFETEGGYRVTPMLGVQWSHLHQEGWNENASGAGVVAQWYDGTDDDYIEIPLTVRINRSFQLSNGMIVTPEARAAVMLDVGPSRSTVRTGFVGSPELTTLHGIDPGKARALIGAGVKANLTNAIDAYMDYNHEFRSGYRNSNLTGGVGLSF